LFLKISMLFFNFVSVSLYFGIISRALSLSDSNLYCKDLSSFFNF
jgi:hypothetical protein